MDAHTQSELLLSVISKFVAERDDAVFRINAILSDNYDYEIDQVEELKQQISRMAKAKLEIEQTQVVYAQIFPPQEQKESQKTPENDNPA